MEIQQYWQQMKEAIDKEIARMFLGMCSETALPGTYIEALAQSLEGGKRLRGTLACLVCDSLGGSILEALPRAVAIEYIHAGTLVQDDIIDDDTLRRGKPAIWTLEGMGKEEGTLLAYLLLARGMRQLSRFRQEDFSTASNALERMISGVLKELWIKKLQEKTEVPDTFFPHLYGPMIRLKTGELFGASGKFGAIAANKPYFYGLAYNYGVECGEAFQIADDLVDIRKKNANSPVWTAIEGRLVRMMSGTLERALLCLNEFPENEYTDLLRALPRFMVEAILKESEQAGTEVVE